MFTSNFGLKMGRWMMMISHSKFSDTPRILMTPSLFGASSFAPTSQKTSFLGYLRLKMHGWSMLISFLGLKKNVSPFCSFSLCDIYCICFDCFLWDLGKADCGSSIVENSTKNPIQEQISHQALDHFMMWRNVPYLKPQSLPEILLILTTLCLETRLRSKTIYC